MLPNQSHQMLRFLPKMESGECDVEPQPKIRSNIASLRPLRLYVPDSDDNVPQVFALARHAMATAKGNEEQLLGGYASALCAVAPSLLDTVKRSMQYLGFQLRMIKIPSEAAELKTELPPSMDLRIEILNLAQMIYLPFMKPDPDYYQTNMNKFINSLRSVVGCTPSVSIPVLLNQSDAWLLRAALGVCNELLRDVKALLSSKSWHPLFDAALSSLAELIR